MTALPTTVARGVQRRAKRFSGLLPDSMLAYRVPRFWQEILLIAAGYWLYSKGRNAIPEQKTIAIRHGYSVENLQTKLHLNFELSVNRYVASHEWLAQIMNYYYATLHFVITIAVLVWLFRTRPRVYRGARTVLFATTLLALVGFYLYPLAPPRLLPQFGYIDTLIQYHTWGSLADPKIAAHSNQYAAMPSLHIGWSLWSGVCVWFSARRAWVRVLGMVYPLCTLMVIVGTANHFVVDAVGGMVVFTVATLMQVLLSGHTAFTPASDPNPPAIHSISDNPANDKGPGTLPLDRQRSES